MVDKFYNFRPMLLIIIIPILFSCASTQQKQVEPKDAEFYKIRGTDYAAKGQYDQAISNLNKAIEINPNSATAYYNRGNVYREKARYDKAIPDYTKALEINPRHAEAYNDRGLSRMKRGQNDKAIFDLTKALEINPSYADAYNNRGMAYMKIEQYDEAISDFSIALAINPNLAVASNNRDEAYRRKDHLPIEISSKIESLRNILDRDPKNLSALVDLGNLYYDNKQPREAIKAYSKYLAKEPDNPDVRTDMGTMYRELGDTDRALKEYRQAAQDDPTHINSRYNLGLILLHDKQDFKGAITAFEEYLSLEPKGERAERVKTLVEKLKKAIKNGMPVYQSNYLLRPKTDRSTYSLYSLSIGNHQPLEETDLTSL